MLVAIIVQVVIILGIVFGIRYFLSRNITTATANLKRLSNDYNRKQEEVTKRLDEAKENSSKMLASAEQEARELKAKATQEVQEERSGILKDAHLQSEQIIQQADKTREFLMQEINQKIEKQAVEKACELIQEVIPDELRTETHSRWLAEFVKGAFEQLDRVRLPDGIQEVNIASAYQLSGDERNLLVKKIREKIGRDIKINEKTDANLIAGLIVTIGSLVIDGSLRHTIQEAAKNVQHSTGQ